METASKAVSISFLIKYNQLLSSKGAVRSRFLSLSESQHRYAFLARKRHLYIAVHSG